MRYKSIERKDEKRKHSLILAIDGSYAPGGNGGWSVVCTRDHKLEWSLWGEIQHCRSIMEAEMQAFIHALKNLPNEKTLIVSDSRTLILGLTGQSNAKNFPFKKDLLDVYKNTQTVFLLQWRPTRALASQRLAHHLANAARVAEGMKQGHPAGRCKVGAIMTPNLNSLQEGHNDHLQ